MKNVFRAQDLTRLIERYMEEAGVRKVYEAFLLAAEAHDGVFRKDGVTPYITHPLEVAHILADLHLDADTICAALLHDVLEDTPYQRDELVVHFGEAVADMVEGVTKLEKDEVLTTKQAVTIASFRKMMQAMTEDFRVVLIKLADRLHNMRTLGNMKADARRRIAEETFATYVPLARRMGMNDIRRQLQSLAFQNLYHWRSQILQHALDVYLTTHEEKHERIVQKVTDVLSAAMPGTSVFPWDKNLFRIYEQCKREGTDFRQQCDLLEIRILVRERNECYQALGVIHELYRPRMGMFNDFIATPKGGYGFQALQTVVMASGQQSVRFQIQTREMYQTAQYGIAAQWRYPDMRTTRKAEYTQAVLGRWLVHVKELDYQAGNPDEFYEDMQADLFQTEIYAYTPAGDVKEFPKGATLVDFAYAVHTQVGHHCIGAKVDGVERPLRTRIPHNMAVIEIITDKHASPQPSWLNFVVTGRAKSCIRNWLRQQTAGEQLVLGRDRLVSALQSRGSQLDALAPAHLEASLKALGYADQDALFMAVGRGDECSRLLSERLLGNMPAAETRQDAPLLIKGTTGLAVKFATCCLPLPPENILAHQHRTRGLEIHRADCPRIARIETSDDVFAVAWAQEMLGQKFSAGVVVDVRDVKGMLRQITQCLENMDVNIIDLNITGEGQVKQDTLIIQVNDLGHLQEVMRQLKHIPNVLNVSRLTKKDSHDPHNHFHD
jgi:RelA/SpoT family (p)ppGpp synthetase